MTDTYPIIKYPIRIESVLKSSKISQIIEDNNDDTDLFKLENIPEPKPNYLEWMLAGALLLAAICTSLWMRIDWLWLLPLGSSSIAAWRGWTRRVKYLRRRRQWQQWQQWQPTDTLARSTSTPTAESRRYDCNAVNRLIRSNQRSKAQIGLSEKYFYERAIVYFPDIEFGCEYLPSGYTVPYSSDLELVLTENLGIQIEIDEPYDGRSRRPHHYRDSDKDALRDRYFSQQLGWTIVRFSERQIVTDPNGCIATIAIVAAMLLDVKPTPKIRTRASRLQRDLRWSAKDSEDMAATNYRENYLAPAGLWQSHQGKGNRRKKHS